MSERHKWEKVNEDMRDSIHDLRPQLYRCVKCDLYRMAYNLGDGYWKTLYGHLAKPEKQHAPVCKK
jgi:hypothetical protein